MADQIFQAVPFIKGAYGFENHHRCAFTEKARKSFHRIHDYMQDHKVDAAWIAIYIPRGSTKFRKENELPSISNFVGHIAAFQEVLNRFRLDGVNPLDTTDPRLSYKSYGYSERWPEGIPARRILRFKEPSFDLKDEFGSEFFSDFVTRAERSEAFPIPEELQAKLLSKFKQCELIEVVHTDLPESG